MCVGRINANFMPPHPMRNKQQGKCNFGKNTPGTSAEIPLIGKLSKNLGVKTGDPYTRIAIPCICQKESIGRK